MSYVIEFRYPEGVMYAGLHKGALGWAPTLKTALVFNTQDEAQQMVNNGYGKAAADYAFVVPLRAGV
jgi:hypothetical protein